MKTNSILKRGIYALGLLCLGCSQETEDLSTGALEEITVSAGDFNIDATSRSTLNITESGAEFAWTANDTVGIIPINEDEESASINEGQAYFPMSSGAGRKIVNFTGGSWALKSAPAYVAYYPFVGDKNLITLDYSGQEQTGNASTAHIVAYDYMAASATMQPDGKANFYLQHLGALVQLKLTLPQPSTLTSVAITAESNVFVIKLRFSEQKK